MSPSWGGTEPGPRPIALRARAGVALLFSTGCAGFRSKLFEKSFIKNFYSPTVLYALKDFLIKRLGSLLEHTT